MKITEYVYGASGKDENLASVYTSDLKVKTKTKTNVLVGDYKKNVFFYRNATIFIVYQALRYQSSY